MMHDFSALDNNVELHIRRCPHAMTLPHLFLRCKKIVLEQMFHLHTVHSLVHCETVVLLNCPTVFTVAPLASPLKVCRSLVVRNSPQARLYRQQLRGSAIDLDCA